MENLVKQGYNVTTDSRGRRVLEAPSGSFFFQKDITKTAMDYAEFLSSVI